MPGARPASGLSALVALALPAVAVAAADARALFHASKPWVDFASSGVVVRELWLDVDGTPLSLVHAVRTSPAVPSFEGELFAVETATGEPWEGQLSTDGCPPLQTLRTLTVLYRQGGVVVVRAGQGDAARKPFGTCGALYRAEGELGACTLRVPIKAEVTGLSSGPDQTRLGGAWLSAGPGRVDVPRSPPAGLKLTTALRECLGDEVPLIAPVEDRVALAGRTRMLLVSEALTGVCLPCDEALTVAPAPVLAPEAVRKKHQAASRAWQAGRRDDALLVWRSLYEAWWSGSRDPAPIWVDVLEAFGGALAVMKAYDQARQVFEECWAMTKLPPESLLVSMGDVYRELGDVDAAKAAYERALAGVPTRAQRLHAATQLVRLRK